MYHYHRLLYYSLMKISSSHRVNYVSWIDYETWTEYVIVIWTVVHYSSPHGQIVSQRSLPILIYASYYYRIVPTYSI